MKSVERVKFDWDRIDEPNCGHTPDEWGKVPEDTEQKPRIIYSYKVKWETG